MKNPLLLFLGKNNLSHLSLVSNIQYTKKEDNEILRSRHKFGSKYRDLVSKEFRYLYLYTYKYALCHW